MSEHVRLERFAYSPYGAFGLLTLPDFECYTIERPWMANMPRISCIPEGEYLMRLGTYYKGGYPAYEVLGVEGRTLIKIHRGNIMDDVLGCIAPGFGLGYIKDKWAVTDSGAAFDAFMATMDGRREAILVVTRINAGRVAVNGSAAH